MKKLNHILAPVIFGSGILLTISGCYESYHYDNEPYNHMRAYNSPSVIIVPQKHYVQRPCLPSGPIHRYSPPPRHYFSQGTSRPFNNAPYGNRFMNPPPRNNFERGKRR